MNCNPAARAAAAAAAQLLVPISVPLGPWRRPFVVCLTGFAPWIQFHYFLAY